MKPKKEIEKTTLKKSQPVEKETHVEYSESHMRSRRRCFIRIMNDIINAIKMTPKELEEYVQFMVWTIPLIMKEGDTLIYELNLHLNISKG